VAGPPPGAHGSHAAPWVRLSAEAARLLRRVASVWLAGVVVLFVALTWFYGVPQSPGAAPPDNRVQGAAQVGLLALLVLGRVLAARWHRMGVVVMAAGAAGLGSLSSMQYVPAVAVGVTVLTFPPAALVWLSWQRTARRRAAVGLAVMTSAVLLGVVTAASATYAHFYGPTHPASSAPAPSRELLDWVWAGGVTQESVVVRARTRRPAQGVSLLVSSADDPSVTVRSAVKQPHATDGDDQIFSLTVSGLRPDTRYSYAVEVDGRTDPARLGRFRTFPSGPASFVFAAGSCIVNGSNGAVFDAIREVDPLFFAITGDFHYSNIERNSPGRFRGALAAGLRSPAQAALYATTAVVYVWDDHDYSGNDGDRTAASRPAAHRSYRDVVPHYPLSLEPEGPIFQAFTVGRVRVVVTDNRSDRTPAGEPDGPGKTMLGAAQRDELLQELRDAHRYAAVIWVNPSPWVQAPKAGSDGWGGYSEERRVIADTIAEAGVRNLVMVSGDAHMLALDDGTNTDYSTRGGGDFPLLHAAALDRPGSVKGGPYSGGTRPGGGQFGTVQVDDDGRSVSVTLTGHDWRGREVMTATVGLPR
jgi:phosphodiesterase/alkaline phosphatase D-like protein